MRFTELCKTNGVEYRSSGHEHCRPGWIQIDCPYCSKAWRHFRLGYNLAYKYFHCWSCGPKKTTNTFMEVFSLQFKEVKDVLKELQAEGDFEKVKVKGKLRLPNYDLIPIADSAPHFSYLKGRGYDPDAICNLWQASALRLAGPYSWRVFIPVYFHGNMVSWTTRSLSDNHSMRYRSAPATWESIPHKSTLYGEDYVRHGVVVCEGPLDVWKIGPGAVATFGTGFRREQILRIARFPIRAICFDSEPDGQRAATRLVEELSVLPGKTYNIVLDAKDPGEASETEISKLRKTFLE